MANLGSERTTVVLCDLLRSGRIGAGREWAGPGFIARLRLALGPRLGNLSGHICQFRGDLIAIASADAFTHGGGCVFYDAVVLGIDRADVELIDMPAAIAKRPYEGVLVSAHDDGIVGVGHQHDLGRTLPRDFSNPAVRVYDGEGRVSDRLVPFDR